MFVCGILNSLYKQKSLSIAINISVHYAQMLKLFNWMKYVQNTEYSLETINIVLEFTMYMTHR